MAQAPQKKLVTPAGLARYLCLDKSEVINGADTKKKSASIVLSDENLKAMAAVVDEFKDENFTPAMLKTYQSPFKSREGQTFIKAATKAYNDDGTDRVVPIFDAKGQPVRGAIRVGNGSLIKLAVTMKPYSFQGKTGMTFYLRGVQVIELVKFQNDFDDESQLADPERAFTAEGADADEFAPAAGVAPSASGPANMADLDDEVPF